MASRRLRSFSRSLFLVLAVAIAFGTLLVILTSRVPGRQHTAGSVDAPDAPVTGGRVDLSGFDLSDGVSLSGQWTFYRNQLVAPADLRSDTPPEPSGLIDVPGMWPRNSVAGDPLPRFGFGTYRLDIATDRSDNPRTLHFYATEVSTAHTVYVGDRLVSSTGEVGRSREETRPQWGHLVGSAEIADGSATVLVQVANFHHARGGMLDPLLVSDSPLPDSWIRFDRDVAFFLFGALLIMGLYHLGIAVVGAPYRSAGLFGCATLLMALRTLIVAPAYILQPESVVTFELITKAEYLTMFLGVVVFVLYTGTLFPHEQSRHAGKVALALAAPFSLLAILTPARIYSATLFAFHPITVCAGIYLGIVAIRALRAGRNGAVVFGIGYVVLFFSVANDLLYNMGLLDTSNVANAGLFFFLFAQGLVLLENFAARHRRTREALREKIRLQHLSLQDALTGIGNRRTFDGVMESEWRRAIRNESTLSLVLFDIDRFKRYNDVNGHQAGDAALTSIAAAATESLERPSDRLTRYGGEEFAIILPETEPQGAIAVAKRVRQRIASLGIPLESGDTATVATEAVLTVSAGVASAVPCRASSIEELVRAADIALYRAKEQGRNRVEQ